VTGIAATFRRIAGSPTGAIGLVLVAILLALALAGPWIAPHSPTAIDVRHRLEGPEPNHLLGTDQLGRDIFSRVVVGTRATIGTALAAICLSLAGATVIGLVAGYGPRWLDGTLILLLDSVSALPMIMLALVAAVLLGPSAGTIVLVIVIYCLPSYARLVRSQTLSLKGRDFILAARALDVPVARILFRHLLPNVVGPLLIIACMDVSTVIGLDAGLSFLGLSADIRVPNWGTILNDGFASIRSSPMMVIGGGVPIVLATLGFTFFGEALHEAVDPRLARGTPP
jgi:peptide/nickel transport system permease protein